ncbi:hypothetical protein LIER_36488 [Lithospermum erythrorhizon]|uniref:RNA-directed DNA polymerase, eukaryota, Reverse transcriptase zinc-binding domain protein n=1 Tax=Lithospermum erythrorhizon TaxID=34254 RepID=A0AAV3P6M4_LITER
MWRLRVLTVGAGNKCCINMVGVIRFMSNVVGDGKSTCFWYDSWHRMGVLVDQFTGGARNLISVSDDTSMADAINAGRWPTRRRLTEEFHPFLQDLPQLNDVKDIVAWNGCGNKVKTTNNWGSLCSIKPKPPCVDLIWFKSHIPRHEFVCYML